MFQDVSDRSGINYTGASYGAAWGDYDRDGLVDLWVNNHGFAPTLYQNQGNGKFSDVTAEVFELPPKGDLHGAAWADFDNDGDLDLIQLVGADVGQGSLEDPQIANQLYVNQEGTFSDRAIALGLDYAGSRGRNPLWFDYDNDSRLDLFQGATQRSDGRVPATIFQQRSNRQFEDLRAISELKLDGAKFGLLSDLVGNSSPELILYRSNLGLTVYDAQSLTDITNSIIDTNYFGQDVVSGDFNGDLLPDLYLTQRGLSSSAYIQPNRNSLNFNLVAQNQDLGFAWQTEGAITVDFWTFGFAEAKIDPKDIFIGSSALNPKDFSSNTKDNKSTTELTLTLNPDDSRVQGLASSGSESQGLYLGYDPDASRWELQLSTADRDLLAGIVRSQTEIIDVEAAGFNNDLEPSGDLLLLNDGSSLVDRNAGSGLNSVRTAGVNAVTGDFDNDMDLDLYVVTTNAAGNEPNVLYDNRGNGTFEPVTNLGEGAGSSLGIGDTVSTTDYNNDGFLDLFLTNGDFPYLLSRSAPYQLLENEGNDNHWLSIDLEGLVSNRDGIGAKVYVTAGGVTQLREQTGGMHDRVQNDSRLHFGLADNVTVDEIRIEWSSGIVQNLNHVAADRVLTIYESAFDIGQFT